jgi:hypothetical protein
MAVPGCGGSSHSGCGPIRRRQVTTHTPSWGVLNRLARDT